MRYLIATLLFLLLPACASLESPSYPTPDGEEQIAAIRVSAGLRDGEILAVRGRVLSIAQVRNKPVLEIVVDDKETVWILYMYEASPAEVGDTIRVLGFPTNDSEFDQSPLEIPAGSLKLLSFAVMNERSNRVSYDPEQSGRQVEAWATGVVPSPRR